MDIIKFLIMSQKLFLNLAIFILNINYLCMLNMEIYAKRLFPLTVLLCF